MAFCGISLSRSLLGVKRTWACAPRMSAFDPKRTWCGHWNFRKIEHRREPPDMQRRGGSTKPAKDRRTPRPKGRKTPNEPASTDHSPEQFDRLKRERDEALDQLAATSEVLQVSALPGAIWNRCFNPCWQTRYASARPGSGPCTEPKAIPFAWRAESIR
jgi:hypothetical protein